MIQSLALGLGNKLLPITIDEKNLTN